MTTIQTIIENRVNSTGVSEPLVQILGTDKVIVEVPGAADPDEIRKLVGTTGRLDFVDLPAATYGTGGATPTTGTQAVPQQGEAIDPTLPVLFSGDQIDPSGVAPGIDPDDRTSGSSSSSSSRTPPPSSPPTPRTTSATTSPSSSTATSSPRRSSRAPSPMAPARSPATSRLGRDEQPRDGPQVRRAAGPAARDQRVARSAPRWGPTSCGRRSSPGPSASCSSSSSCSSTTACRASWPASP